MYWGLLPASWGGICPVRPQTFSIPSSLLRKSLAWSVKCDDAAALGFRPHEHEHDRTSPTRPQAGSTPKHRTQERFALSSLDRREEQKNAHTAGVCALEKRGRQHEGSTGSRAAAGQARSQPRAPGAKDTQLAIVLDALTLPPRPAASRVRGRRHRGPLYGSPAVEAPRWLVADDSLPGTHTPPFTPRAGTGTGRMRAGKACVPASLPRETGKRKAGVTVRRTWSGGGHGDRGGGGPWPLGLPERPAR